MSSSSVNDVGYESRMSFARNLLQNTLGFEIVEIEPIGYEHGCQFPFNNYSYSVRIKPATAPESQHERQPGTQPIPIGHDKFILRLSSLLYHDHAVRVESEIAAIQLVRTALQPHLEHLLPRVFRWSNGSDTEHGWSLQELMPGKEPVYDFDDMAEEQQRKLLEQIVDIVQALQRFTVPDSVTRHGLLTFNDSGEVVSRRPQNHPAHATLGDSSPSDSYHAFLIYLVQLRLIEADKNPFIQGWHADGLRARLDRFARDGFPLLLRRLTNLDRTFIHGDLTMGNVLYDPATMRLTAFFDFDTAHIGIPGEEFVSSDRRHAQYYDHRDTERIGSSELRKAMLDGFPDPLPSPANSHINFPVAKMWDDLLRARDLSRPGNTPEINVISEIFWFIEQIEPLRLRFHFLYEDDRGPKRVRGLVQDELIRFLETHNF